MIEIREVSKFYGSVAALRDVSLSVAPGELVLLLGANGAGKSTLVRSILGILSYHGEIRVAGLDPLVDGTRVRGRIGYMPQGGGLHGDVTVAETVDFYSALRGVDGARGHELLAGVGLSGALDARVAELSGGMLQRLSFALACLSDPPVLLLDEPTASLDAASRLAVGARLRRLADDGKAILLSTHSESQLEGLADRAITLEAGRIVDVRRPAPAGLRVAPGPRSGGVGYPPGKARGALARISHRRSAAGAERRVSTASRWVGLLDVLSNTPASPSRRAPCIHAPLHALATNRDEKCGLAPRPAGPGRARPPAAVWQLARKGMRDALHDRWLITYALLLGALGVVAALLGLRSSAGMGLQMFGRTTATLTNLCLMLAPLVGLSMGAAAIAGERDRGTMETLLAQPLERRDLLLGKYLGLLLALAAATVVGFLPAAFVVARYAGAASLLGYVLFPLLSVFLIGAMLGLGLLISVRSHGGAQAQGRAIFCWFLFVLMYDLLLMGTLVTSGLSSTALALLLVANPVDAARVLVVLALEPDLYLLGPAGALLVAELSRAGTAALLMITLLVWAVVPVGLALLSFRLRRQRSLPAGRTVVVSEIKADIAGEPAVSEPSKAQATRGRCLEPGLPPVEDMEVS